MLKHILAVAAFTLCASQTLAATITAASFGADATGNTSFGLIEAGGEADGSILNRVQSRFDGALQSYSIWVGANMASDAVLELDLLRSFSPTDRIGTQEFMRADLANARTVTGGNGREFFELVWDVSGFGETIAKGDTIDVIIRQTAGNSAIAISGNDAFASGGLPRESRTTTSFEFDFPGNIGIAFSGSARRSIGYQLAVDDAIVPAPVPLPAGLPLLLVGLGGFVIVKRRKEI